MLKKELSHLFDEKSMEPEREGDDEERADDGELEERLQHVREHDHVDPQEGELPHVGE